jgi:rhodanese-related sulfurtransferase
MVTDDTAMPRPLLAPDGIFVIHLRSDSAAARQHLIGRVEHVKSGDSEQFASLEALLAFVDRHMQSAADDRER